MPKSPSHSILPFILVSTAGVVLVLVVFTVRALCEPARFLPDDIKRNDLVSSDDVDPTTDGKILPTQQGRAAKGRRGRRQTPSKIQLRLTFVGKK